MLNRENWLTIAEVSRRIGAPEATVRAWATSGTGPFPFHSFKSDRRAWHVDVSNFISDGTQPEVTLAAMVEAGVERALLGTLHQSMLRADVRLKAS